MLAADRLEPEAAGLGHLGRGGEPLGEVGPELTHLLRPLQRPLGVGEEAAARLLHGRPEPHAGEHVLKGLTAPVVGVHVVRHRHRDAEALPHAARGCDARLLSRHVMARHRQREPPPESLLQPRRHLGVGSGIEGEEPARPLGHRAERHVDRLASPGRLALARILPAARLGEEPAELGVALAILRQEHQRRRRHRPTAGEVGHRQLGPHHQRKPLPLRLGVGAHRAVEPVHVGERERFESELGRGAHELLRVARPAQEREARLAAQLGVAVGGHGRGFSRRIRGARAARRRRRGRSSTRPAPRPGRGDSRGRRARPTTPRRAAPPARARGRAGSAPPPAPR